jgi:hypothetical protein
MNAKQYAWIYMIDNGHANMTPSYYGGWDYIDDKGSVDTRGRVVDFNAKYANQIREIGVDWDATQSPNGRSYSTFEGTFADPGSTEYLEGTLVLKNGSQQRWIAEPLVTTAFEMMANIEKLQSKFKDLVGAV